MRIILDTSAALCVVMRGQQSLQLITALESATTVLCPQFSRVEMGNALCKYIRWQDLPLASALQHLDDAAALVDVWIDDASLMPQALSLAAQHERPVYDMLYMAAALQQGAKLLTLDRTLMAVADKINAPLKFGS
jgi:predicted nucleic acid-binding protein